MEEIAAIIVTYNIGAVFEDNLSYALANAGYIYIIDNGSGPETTKMLQKINFQFDNVQVIYNSSNLGLAAAQNQGIELAIANKFDWVLLLDHDSQPQEDMVKNLLDSYYKTKYKERIGILAPQIYDINTGKFAKFILKNGKFWFKAVNFPETESLLNPIAVISSGSLVKTKLFQEIGMFNEDFFIDYIDSEFCLRARDHGYEIIAVKNATLNHKLGEQTSHRLLGKTIITTNHNNFRRFYIARNRKKIWVKYLTSYPAYCIYDMLAAGYDIFRVILFEQDKVKKLYALARGYLS